MASPATAGAEIFHHRFGSRSRCFFAPGRVNLIGEHVDYNAGVVLPMAIELRLWVWAAPRSDRQLHIIAHDLGEIDILDLDVPCRHTGTWRDYIAGTAFHLEAAGFRLAGANLLIMSDIPTGAGLSSSAALEVAVGFALLTLAGHPIDRLTLARAGQAAEHDFVGARCGLMDQFVVAHGRAGHAVWFDCRSNDFAFIPVDTRQCAIAIADSGVRHRLAASAYNKRRQECERALHHLRQWFPHLTTLREITAAELVQVADRLPENLLRRARHVVAEIERVAQFAQALRAGDWPSAGALLNASHRSLSEDYAVSCNELDALADIARQTSGCYGARLTGGGFGGCTVNLVAPEALDAFLREVPRAYAQATGHIAQMWVARPGDGVGEKH
ncbi:MAG: galactokinase [Acidobacteriota bacterium]